MPKTTTTTLTKVTKKRSKDPNAPKRFRTAYLLFSNEKREQVKVKKQLKTFFFFFFFIIFVRSERKSEFSRKRNHVRISSTLEIC